MSGVPARPRRKGHGPDDAESAAPDPAPTDGGTDNARTEDVPDR